MEPAYRRDTQSEEGLGPRSTVRSTASRTTCCALVRGSRMRSSEPVGRSCERDTELADQVSRDDADVNQLQRQINRSHDAHRHAGPVARDVRELLALYHASAELERMGDYAVNIAKLAQQLAGEPETPILRQIPRMEQICREQLRAAMRALVDVSEDEPRAAQRTTRSTTSTTASTRTRAAPRIAPERARQTTHMLFAAHHLQRLGDRVTNIGEDVVFLATGQVEDLNP